MYWLIQGFQTGRSTRELKISQNFRFLGFSFSTGPEFHATRICWGRMLVFPLGKPHHSLLLTPSWFYSLNTHVAPVGLWICQLDQTLVGGCGAVHMRLRDKHLTRMRSQFQPMCAEIMFMWSHFFSINW